MKSENQNVKSFCSVILKIVILYMYIYDPNPQVSPGPLHGGPHGRSVSQVCQSLNLLQALALQNGTALMWRQDVQLQNSIQVPLLIFESVRQLLPKSDAMHWTWWYQLSEHHCTRRGNQLL